MKIKSFTYEDKARDWRVDPIDFNELTLLVGASGVGKTQILRAIRNLVEIADGESLNGVTWNVEFELFSNNFYKWSGAFECITQLSENNDDDQDDLVQPKIVSESLSHNGITIVKRDVTDIYFKGEPTIKLSQNQSVVHLIKADPIMLIGNQLRKIIVQDYSDSRRSIVYRRILNVNSQTYDDLKGIRESYERIRTKLYLCSLIAAKTFDEIKQIFIDVFPLVEDVRFQPIKMLSSSEYPIIQLKERGVNRWINETNISSGMYRVLGQLSALYLCADGTVFLIDEFENSLGVNCIDDLTRIMLSQERDLQFIITSHHPYIINSIGYKHWKIVTRHGGVVTAKDATEYNLGRSKHEAFTQLINLDAYSEGITG